MSVIPYWMERLRERQPFRSETLRVEANNFRAWSDRVDTWPRAVAKQALLQDYLRWHEEVYLLPFLETGFYRDCPDQLPKPLSDLDFFITMSPFLHVVGRDQQTRAYKVTEQKLHEGQWYPVKIRRNFVRLMEWDDHVAQFELVTGISLNMHSLSPQRATANMDTVARSVKVSIKKMAANKEAMAIGKKKVG